MVDFGAIGVGVLKTALSEAAKVIIGKVKKQLNPTELEKYIKSGITAALDEKNNPPHG